MKASSWLLFLVLTFSSFFAQASRLSYPHLLEPNRLPQNCEITKDQTCLVYVKPGFKWVYTEDKAKASLGSDSSVLFTKTEDRIEKNLVKGELWVEGAQTWNVEYGSVECVGDCGLFLKKSAKSLSIQVFKGSALLRPKGSKEVLQLPLGYENTLSRVSTKTGEAQTQIPKPIFFRTFVKKWAQFYDGSKEDFVKELILFQRHWAVAVHKSSDKYKDMALREIASENKKASEAQIRKQKQQAADKELRELFQKRSFGF